jgi:plasmid stabilization system protein ParE
MRFTVSWRPEAEDNLAIAWMIAADRQAVTQASHRADEILASAPDQGQEFYGDWLLAVPPLYVVYNYSVDKRQVTVLDVWYH